MMMIAELCHNITLTCVDAHPVKVTALKKLIAHVVAEQKVGRSKPPDDATERSPSINCTQTERTRGPSGHPRGTECPPSGLVFVRTDGTGLRGRKKSDSIRLGIDLKISIHHIIVAVIRKQ